MKKIFVSEPSFNAKEKSNLLKCFDSGFISSIGSNVEKFENEIKKYTKAKFCVACINGTSALHVSLKVIGVEKNHEVIAPTMSFVATVNSILYIGASPIFMDCDKYLNIDVSKTINFIKKNTFTVKNKTFNKKTKKRISAVVVAHMYGNLCNFTKLKKICLSKGIKIVEDAAETIGSFFLNGTHSGLKSDIGIYSFNGNKIVTSGGGGAIVSKNKKFIDKARKLINQSKINSIEYEHDEIGFNYRISNLHASVGIMQMKKIKKYISIKKKIYNFYKKEFKENLNFEILKNNKVSKSNNWINILKIKNQKFSKTKIMKYLSKNNIEVRPIWYPLHQQKFCNRFEKYKIHYAVDLHNACICLPSSVSLKRKQLKKITNLIKSYEN